MKALRLLFLTPLLLAAPAAAAAEDAIAWELLTRVRDSVTEAAPLAADFDQTFLPSGFESGDTEHGRMILALPNCMRWDYLEPYERTYLLCGRVVHSWNPGEAAGRRQVLSAEDEHGLELIRLEVDELRARYRVSLEDRSPERARIVLEPLEPGEIRDAELDVDIAAARLLSLTFHDREGNRTRFDFAAYRAAEADSPLEPPDGVRWLDE